MSSPNVVRAAFEQDVHAVTELLAAGVSVNQRRGPRGTSALHAACYQGNVEIVQLLCDRGAKINVRDGAWTPLHIAASRGYGAVARALILRGADINAELVLGSQGVQNKGWNAFRLFGTSRSIHPPELRPPPSRLGSRSHFSLLCRWRALLTFPLLAQRERG